MKPSQVRQIAIILLLISITFVSLIPLTTNQPETDLSTPLKTNEGQVVTHLTATISADGPQEKISQKPDSLNPESVSPTVILRGRSFIARGRLIDLLTFLGIPNEPIWIYWSYFTWTDLETDRTNLDNNFKIGEGITDSNGNFSITCVDNDHSKRVGLVTVYAVFPGDPLLGPIELNRQYTTDTIECYATVTMEHYVNTSIVREGDSFIAAAYLVFDNHTYQPPQPVSDANGNDITFDWLGSLYNITIVTDFAGTILDVPMGTTVGVDHPLKGSFNISTLGLAYTVGDINTEAEIGSIAADWCNFTTNIYVFTGAGLVFDIDEPIAPGIGVYPEVVRGNTTVTLSGVLSDSGGSPFGYGVDLTVLVAGSSTIGVTTENNGNFSISFIINATSLPVGDNPIIVDVVTGQGITAITETEYITVLGNSTILTPSVNGTSVLVENPFAMPNETLQISGTIRDAYSSAAVANMNISAQWEGSGLVYETYTSPTGAFSISLLIPPTFNPTLRNGTVNLFSTSTQYYTPSNYSFLVDVFAEALYTITLNSTIVIDDSNVTTIGGESIYINSNLTFNGFVVDQFGRPIKSRTITISISGLGSIGETLNDSGYFSIAVNNTLGYTENITYTITITFDADTSYDFNFDIAFRSVPEETPAPGPNPPSSPNGDPNQMAMIYILITVVSLIIIVSIVYAFGRLRKSKKGTLPGPDAELMDLSSIMKQIAEADKAKDYRRGIVLGFRAFELICMQSLRILSARDQSPRELARLVASTNRIPVRDVTMLVMRYEEARYSDHRITKNQFNHAMQALENVQLALKQDPKVT